ncbi:hypothetical protein H6P81_013546 [Aristolochia fimbriata]|uniref:Uncharacterized protein n=1 Tax=Aristolochia fimbriata TaxID=158543 RepID=A0AAV7EF93_ARIFI|nr:hypothetical protein H6P81_013546 [Aristolochia fimbriata]
MSEKFKCSDSKWEEESGGDSVRGVGRGCREGDLGGGVGRGSREGKSRGIGRGNREGNREGKSGGGRRGGNGRNREGNQGTEKSGGKSGGARGPGGIKSKSEEAWEEIGRKGKIGKIGRNQEAQRKIKKIGKNQEIMENRGKSRKGMIKRGIREEVLGKSRETGRGQEIKIKEIKLGIEKGKSGGIRGEWE